MRIARLLGLAFLLPATLAGATEPIAAIPGEARVATAADVKSLCARNTGEAGDDTPPVYLVTLPSSAFTFLPYEDGRARLAIDGARGFRPEKAGYELVLHDLTGKPVTKPVLELAIPAAAEEAKSIARAHQSGSLELTLWFQPAGPDSCAAVHRYNDDGIRMAIEPIAFAITKGTEQIASGEMPAFAALREASSPVISPRVVVSAPMLTAVNGKAPSPVAKVAAKLEAKLTDCYRQGLAAEPTLRGSMVAGVELAADGHVLTARAELDMLGEPGVIECALDLVRATKFPKGTERLSIPIRFSSAE